MRPQRYDYNGFVIVVREGEATPVKVFEQGAASRKGHLASFTSLDQACRYIDSGEPARTVAGERGAP